jgi:hypothetical protein
MHKRITVSGDREEMNMEELANEFEAWKGEQGFADEYDANELLMMDGCSAAFVSLASSATGSRTSSVVGTASRRWSTGSRH